MHIPFAPICAQVLGQSNFRAYKLVPCEYVCAVAKIVTEAAYKLVFCEYVYHCLVCNGGCLQTGFL